MVIERAELRAYVVSAIDDGRILNPKTVRSQIIGGIAGGIGMALLRETVGSYRPLEPKSFTMPYEDERAQALREMGAEVVVGDATQRSAENQQLPKPGTS
jgi:hypothetical protein